jgi:aerobic-type carbon monoxide dehydrogenase small subunit (CoxS/CutS family)
MPMAEKEITLTVNGKPQTVKTEASRSLLEVLREDLGLTGTKYGCGEGQCAACTVLVNDKATFGCLTTIGDVAGKSVTTIEGLAKGEALHPVQEAFLAEGAFQCGYCTPGMIMGTVALLAENPHPTDEQIVAKMNGHLCRCCGYTKILSAIRRAAGGGK